MEPGGKKDTLEFFFRCMWKILSGYPSMTGLAKLLSTPYPTVRDWLYRRRLPGLPVAAIEYFVAAQDSEERIRAALEMLKNKPAPAPRILASALQGLTVQERRNAMADLMQVKEPPDKTFLFRHSDGSPPLIWVQPDNRSLADIAKDMSAGQIREDFRNILHSRGGYGTCFAARVVAHVILAYLYNLSAANLLDTRLGNSLINSIPCERHQLTSKEIHEWIFRCFP